MPSLTLFSVHSSLLDTMDNNLIGTQIPPPDTEPIDNEPLPDEREEEDISSHSTNASAEPEYDPAQYHGIQQGEIQESVEGNIEPEDEMLGQFVDQEVAGQEQGDTDMDDARVDSQDAAHAQIRETYEADVDPTTHASQNGLENNPDDVLNHDLHTVPEDPQTTPDYARHHPSSNFRSAYVEDPEHNSNASTLFVSERPSLSPSAFDRTSDFPSMPPPARPSETRDASRPLSTYAKIREIQKKFQGKKAAAKKRTSSFQYGNLDPDSETYLEAVISGQSRAMGVKGPDVDEDEMAHRQATAEFQKQKQHFDELRRKNGGTLPFRHDIKWMNVKGTEDARLRKRKRDLAYAEEDANEPELFPEVNPLTVDEREDESDDGIDLDERPRKRRRGEMPRKEVKQISMQDAELQSMQVALEARDDIPKKKGKGQAGDDISEAPQSSGKGKTPKSKPTRKGAKASTKTTAKGGRKTAKDKKLVEHALKQASSLFTSDVFQQQAGSNAIEQPTFSTGTRRKGDALKELIASVPLGDKKAAKSDMNTLLAATKDFNGRGSVKPHGNSGWMVKGMKTALKGYQVLGTAFMRRRENDHQEPRGGLMADQMGLGKTLMMLGK